MTTQSSSKNQQKLNSINDMVMVSSAQSTIQNLVMCTNRGTLSVLGLPPQDLQANRIHSTVHSHKGASNHLLASADGNWVFSAGKDGNIFVY